jgi:hypothetical protein
MKRILLAALLGGIAMFAWKSIAHMVLPLGQSWAAWIEILGAKSLTAGQMIAEFVTECLEALLAAILLSRTRIPTYAGRVGFVTLLGVLASMATNLSYWNWYGFPVDYTAVYIMIEIVGFICVGLVAAWQVR